MVNRTKKLSSFFALLLSFLIVGNAYAQTPTSSSNDSAQVKRLAEELKLLKLEIQQKDQRTTEILMKILDKVQKQDDRIYKIINNPITGCDFGLENEKSDNKTRDADAKK